MKYYKYSDFDDEHIYSEEDIIREYYSHWKLGMERLGKVDQINKKNCIEDWRVVHWAEKATEEEYATRAK